MEQKQKILLEDIENRINECEHREKYLDGKLLLEKLHSILGAVKRFTGRDYGKKPGTGTAFKK